MKKDLAYYRSLPYSLQVERFREEEDGQVYFRAKYEELPQVKGVHQDRLVAIQLAKELFDTYVEALLSWGEEIPEPEQTRYRKRGGLFKFEADSGPHSEGSVEPRRDRAAPGADTDSTSGEPATAVRV